MQPGVRSGYVNIFLVCLLYRVFWNKEMLCNHFLSYLLWNVPLGRSKKTGGWGLTVSETHHYIDCIGHVHLLSNKISATKMNTDTAYK